MYHAVLCFSRQSASLWATYTYSITAKLPEAISARMSLGTSQLTVYIQYVLTYWSCLVISRHILTRVIIDHSLRFRVLQIVHVDDLPGSQCHTQLFLCELESKRHDISMDGPHHTWQQLQESKVCKTPSETDSSHPLLSICIQYACEAHRNLIYCGTV